MTFPIFIEGTQNSGKSKAPRCKSPTPRQTDSRICQAPKRTVKQRADSKCGNSVKSTMRSETRTPLFPCSSTRKQNLKQIYSIVYPNCQTKTTKTIYLTGSSALQRRGAVAARAPLLGLDQALRLRVGAAAPRQPEHEGGADDGARQHRRRRHPQVRARSRLPRSRCGTKETLVTNFIS